MKPTARPNKENSQWGNPQRRLENWENANAEWRLVLSSSHAFRYRFYFPQLLSLVAHFHHSYSNTCKLLTVCRQSRLHARRRGIKTQAWLILTHSCWDKKPFAESLTYPLHLCAISISCGQTETQVNILHADGLRWKSGAKVLLTYWFWLVDSMGENSEPALKLQITVWELLSALLSSSVGGIWSPTACPQLPDTSPYVVMLVPLTSPTPCRPTSFKLWSVTCLWFCSITAITAQIS